MVPKTTVAIADESTAKQVVRLVEGLEDNDDVQDVYANFDIPEAVSGGRVPSGSWQRPAAPRRCDASHRIPPPPEPSGPSVPSCREGPRHRPRDGCVRVRDRPRKRRASQGPCSRVLDVKRQGAPGTSAHDDLRRSHRAHPEHGPDAVALEESFVGADARIALFVGQARGAALVAAASRRGRVHRVRAGARQAGGLRVRPGRQGPGRADGADAARARRPSRRRRTRRTRSPSRSATRRCRRSRGWRREGAA